MATCCCCCPIGHYQLILICSLFVSPQFDSILPLLSPIVKGAPLYPSDSSHCTQQVAATSWQLPLGELCASTFGHLWLLHLGPTKKWGRFVQFGGRLCELEARLASIQVTCLWAQLVCKLCHMISLIHDDIPIPTNNKEQLWRDQSSRRVATIKNNYVTINVDCWLTPSHILIFSYSHGIALWLFWIMWIMVWLCHEAWWWWWRRVL